MFLKSIVDRYKYDKNGNTGIRYQDPLVRGSNVYLSLKTLMQFRTSPISVGYNLEALTLITTLVFET